MAKRDSEEETVMSAFEEGAKARMRGRHRIDNPHLLGARYGDGMACLNSKQWDEGWCEANKGDNCENWKTRGDDE